ncbi:MAG TPA: hypothetical protein VLC09_03205 [Polyangiaceae bacterium]|nr:hypothetical protein [Polyangiaceae bacterium]
MRPRLPACLPILVLLAGCTRDPGAAGSGSSGTSSPPPGSATSAASTPSHPQPTASPAKPADRELEQARQSLAEWQAAQAAHDFDRYSALYADAFRGVKQIGDRRIRFHRKSWLADRRPMFEGQATVQVSGAEFVRVDGKIAAFFDQEFTSPQFRDRGRKVIVFQAATHGDQRLLRIVREEMLSSTVLGGGGSVATLPGFFFARRDAVVLRSSVEAQWLTPARQAVARAFRAAVENPEGAEWPDESFLTWSELQVPAEVLAARGKKLYVTRAPSPGAKSLPPPCEVTVSRLDVANTGTAAFESTRGAQGLDHVYGSVLLGYFDHPCEGALWASETPPGAQFLPTPPAREQLASAVRDLRAHPEARTRALAADTTIDAALFGDPAGTRLLFVELSRDPWYESFASVSALFELTRDAAQPHLLGVVATDTSLAPLLAFDSNADGGIELLAKEADDDSSWHVLRIHGGKAQAVRVYTSPNFVCPG